MHIEGNNSLQQLEEELIIRKNIYNFLGAYFYNPQSAEELKKVIEENPFEELRSIHLNEYFMKGIDLLEEFCKNNLETEPQQLSKRLKEEFYRLFIGPERLKAPPYESFYLGKDKIVFDVQTLQIRDCYHSWGLEVEKKYQEPDDHIGIELQFMSYLIDQAVLSLNGKKETLYENLFDQQYFLSQHILAFGPDFFQLVIDNTREDFYQGLAFLAHGFLKEDLNYLRQLQKEWELYFKMAQAI